VLEARPSQERVNGWRDYWIQASTITIALLILLVLRLNPFHSSIEAFRRSKPSTIYIEASMTWSTISPFMVNPDGIVLTLGDH
jgi:hypothetical protein